MTHSSSTSCNNKSSGLTFAYWLRRCKSLFILKRVSLKYTHLYDFLCWSSKHWSKALSQCSIFHEPTKDHKNEDHVHVMFQSSFGYHVIFRWHHRFRYIGIIMRRSDSYAIAAKSKEKFSWINIACDNTLLYSISISQRSPISPNAPWKLQRSLLNFKRKSSKSKIPVFTVFLLDLAAIGEKSHKNLNAP